MVYAAVISFGIVSFAQLNRELLPSLPVPAARVITEYQGIPASEIETLVTIPVENALSSVKAVREISSVSKDELSAVHLLFDWGVDRQQAAVEIREKIDALYPFLPHGADKPLVFATEDISDQPVLTLAVVPVSGRRIRDISNLVRGELATRLQQISGVASLRIVGLEEAEIRVDADRQKLAAAGVPLQVVAHVVASSIYDAPLGTVIEGEREYLVKATTDVDTVEEIRQIPVATAGDGSVVSVEEFAHVYWDVRDRTSFFHYNGREAVGIFVSKTPESGSLNTVRNVRNSLRTLGSMFANDLEVQIAKDPTNAIESGIRTLLIAMALGCVSVFLVLLLLFRRATVALIVSASIPAAMMVVFLFMKFVGISLNIISLSGIVIGIGMIVDNSIVVLYSLLQARAVGARGIAVAAGRSTKAIIGSTMTTLLVFLPIVFIRGVTGALFRDLALTVACLLIASFLCAVTLTPALYALIGPNKMSGTLISRSIAGMRRVYTQYLEKVLIRPFSVVVILTFLVVAAILSFIYLPKRILPDIASGEYEIRVAFPAQTPIELCRSRSRQIAIDLYALDGVASVFAAAGYERNTLLDRSEPDRDPRIVRFRIHLSDIREKQSSAVLAEIGRVLDYVPGVHYAVSRPKDSVRLLLGASAVLKYRLTGIDRELLLETAKYTAEQLTDNRLVSAAALDTVEEAPRIQLKLKPARLASHQAEPAVVLDSLRTAFRGHTGAQFHSGGRNVAIRVRLDPADLATEDQLKRIRIPVERELIETGVLATFEHAYSYQELHRFNRTPAVTLTLLPVPGCTDKIATFLTIGAEPYGELLTVSALKQNQRHIWIVFIFAIFLMYLLLGAQFESFVLPLILLLSLLPALSGSLVALLLCGYSLNINSFLGILILLGTAINISIILVVGYRQGKPITRQHILNTSAERLKPIAATVLSTVVAMIRIAVHSIGEAALQSNTAVALVGGLLVGLVFILLIFPVLYDRLTRAFRSLGQ
jgi:HAE1 family hydrophobic/amphiphilic exporter-1